MITYDPTTKRYLIESTCPDCGAKRVIKAGSKNYGESVRCRTCANRVKPPRKKRPEQWTGETVSCKQCGKPFYRHRCTPDHQFCSHRCASEWKRVYSRLDRICSHCGKSFVYTPRPYSNSAGLYCSVRCRGLANQGKYRGRKAHGHRGNRPGWNAIRKAFFAANNDFCCVCGRTDGRLSVHHIEPYRLSQNNDPGNLVTTCPKCHSRLERLSEMIEAVPPARRQLAILLVKTELADWWHIHQGRRLQARSGS